MRYLVTGHTGFKGAWLSLWLAQRGHEVYGLALDPEPGSLFETARVSDRMVRDARGDIRDQNVVSSVLAACDPEVLIHMAAQPLVRDSYRRPRWTMETNVMGTLNVLEAANSAASLKAQVVITTDKVYRNVNQVAGYRESDPLGGDDPYSASKAMADILTQSWVHSFPGARTAIARAGNVIGGGDISTDRLFPDIVRALAAGSAPRLRYPQAVRPWQHVLDCLHGYLTLVDRMLKVDSPVSSGSAWNFGPDEESFVTVGNVTRLASARWGAEGPWANAPEPEYREAGLLALDAEKARDLLAWRNLLPLDDAINWTIDWYRFVDSGAEPREVTMAQLAAFEDLIAATEQR